MKIKHAENSPQLYLYIYTYIHTYISYMTNLRGSPNSGPGILTVGFSNLEHINICVELSIPFIYATLKKQAWNKIRDIFVLKLNSYKSEVHKRDCLLATLVLIKRLIIII